MANLGLSCIVNKNKQFCRIDLSGEGRKMEKTRNYDIEGTMLEIPLHYDEQAQM